MDNDYELLYLAKDDDTVKKVIYEKYKNLIYKKSKKYSQISSNTNKLDDYINEATLALYETIDNYKDTTPYIIYLNTCIENSLKNLLKKEYAKKSKALNESISINNNDNYLIKSEENKYNPEAILFEEFDYDNLRNLILNKLTWQEELIFNLKEQSYNTKEIAEIIDNNQRTVYNIINNIRKKVSSIVSNENN